MTASFIACIDESGDESLVFLPGEKGTGPFAAASFPPGRVAQLTCPTGCPTHNLRHDDLPPLHP